MLTKLALKGSSYSEEEFLTDLKSTGISMATAGLMSSEAMKGVLGELTKAVAGRAPEIIQTGVQQALHGAVSTLATNSAMKVVDPEHAGSLMSGVELAALGGGLGGMVGQGLKNLESGKFMEELGKGTSQELVKNVGNPDAKGAELFVGLAAASIAALGAHGGEHVAEARKEAAPAKTTSNASQTCETETSKPTTAEAESKLTAGEKAAVTESLPKKESDLQKPAQLADEHQTTPPPTETANTTTGAKPMTVEGEVKTAPPPTEAAHTTTGAKPMTVEGEVKPMPAETKEAPAEVKAAPAETKPTPGETKGSIPNPAEEQTTPAKPAATPAEEAEAKRKTALDGLRQATDEAKAEHNGVLTVEDARNLQARAAELGIPASALPRASTPEEILLAKGPPDGMTREEIEIYKTTLNRDGQAYLTDEEMKAGTKNWVQDDHRLDAQGNQRKPLTTDQMDVLIKANAILYEDFVAGAAMSKVVPAGAVGELLLGKGKFGGTKLAGDLALAHNTEGMNAEDKVRHLGLDYVVGADEQHPYVQGSGANKEVKPEVKQQLFQIDQKVTPEVLEKAKVVVGVDLYEHALEKAKALAAQKAAGAKVEIPKLLELDANGTLAHMTEPRARNSAENPSTGLEIYAASARSA